MAAVVTGGGNWLDGWMDSQVNGFGDHEGWSSCCGSCHGYQHGLVFQSKLPSSVPLMNLNNWCGLTLKLMFAEGKRSHARTAIAGGIYGDAIVAPVIPAAPVPVPHGGDGGPVGAVAFIES